MAQKLPSEIYALSKALENLTYFFRRLTTFLDEAKKMRGQGFRLTRELRNEGDSSLKAWYQACEQARTALGSLPSDIASDLDELGRGAWREKAQRTLDDIGKAAFSSILRLGQDNELPDGERYRDALERLNLSVIGLHALVDLRILSGDTLKRLVASSDLAKQRLKEVSQVPRQGEDAPAAAGLADASQPSDATQDLKAQPAAGSNYQELVDALQAIPTECLALAETLVDPMPPDDWTPDSLEVRLLRSFWLNWDTAQRSLDALPSDALQDLATLAGKPWDLTTRRTLDAIAVPFRYTRNWLEESPDPAIQKDRAKWLAIALGHNFEDFEELHSPTWLPLLADLERLTLDLQAIRGRRYLATPGPVDAQRSGTSPELRATATVAAPVGTERQEWFLRFRLSPEELGICGVITSPRWNTFARLGDMSEADIAAVVDALPHLFTNSDDDGSGGIIEYPAYEFEAKPVASVKRSDYVLAESDLAELKDHAQLQPPLRRLLAALTPGPVDVLSSDKYPAQPYQSPPAMAIGGDGGMTWPVALDKADKIRLAGKPFTSYRKMAKAIGCLPSVLHDAIKEHGTVEMQQWATKQRGPSRLNAAPEVSAVGIENTPQTCEPNPADITEDGDVDVMLARLLDQAGPDERARIHAMTPAEKRQLAETAYRDLDLEEQIDRRRRAKRSPRD